MTDKRTSASGTVTRGSLTTVVQRKLGFSQRESRLLVDDMLDTLADFLVNEGEAKLSSFGRFQVRSKGARKGRNPKTGEIVPIAPRRVVSFRPSLSVRARIRAARNSSVEDKTSRNEDLTVGEVSAGSTSVENLPASLTTSCD